MSASRRAVLKAGFAATAAVAGAAAGAPLAVAKPGSHQAGYPPVDGEVRTDPATLAEAAEDFGHIIHRTPAVVLLPASDSDVVTAVRVANQARGKVAPQGQSHSVYGRAMTDSSGGVVDMSTRAAIGNIQNDRVVVEAGATWGDVLSKALTQGKTPPVLTDYLQLSVGGTLVVGGVGGTTSRYGVQSDNVVSMEVVTGRGDRVTCSPTNRRELFNAVRAGLGQVAVILRATIKLVAAPQSVRRFFLFYNDLATMLRDARLLSADNRFDVVQGAILAAPTGGWVYRLDAAKYFTGTPPNDAALTNGLSDDPARRQASTLSYFDYSNRLAALEAALRANGQWFYPHPWLTTFIGDSRVESVVSAELARTNPATDLGPFGQIVLSPIKRSGISSPLLRLPSDSLSYAFNFVRVPPTPDINEANRLVTVNRGIYDRVKAAGGTLYPVSAFPMSSADWRAHFGSAFSALNSAKRTYDPLDVMTPGYEVF